MCMHGRGNAWQGCTSTSGVKHRPGVWGRTSMTSSPTKARCVSLCAPMTVPCFQWQLCMHRRIHSTVCALHAIVPYLNNFYSVCMHAHTSWLRGGRVAFAFGLPHTHTHTHTPHHTTPHTPHTSRVNACAHVIPTGNHTRSKHVPRVVAVVVIDCDYTRNCVCMCCGGGGVCVCAWGGGGGVQVASEQGAAAICPSQARFFEYHGDNVAKVTVRCPGDEILDSAFWKVMLRPVGDLTQHDWFLDSPVSLASSAF